MDVAASNTRFLLHCSFLGFGSSELGSSVGSSGSGSGSGSGLGFGAGVGFDVRLPEKLENSDLNTGHI